MSKKILLATRPLVPPWDEASKNFAYFLGKEIRDNSLTLLSTEVLLTGLPPSVHQEAIFRSGHFDLKAKWNLLRYLRATRPKFDITHYLFTPTKWNTRIIRALARPTAGKTVQTVATLRDDLYSPEELKELFFADRLITYTALAKQKLERLGFQSVTHISPGIDLDRYSPQTKNPDLLKQFGFTEEQCIVIYPGEYVRLGATDMLTEAFIGFFRNNPATALRFVFACRVKNAADAAKKEVVHKRFADASLLAYVAFSDTIADMPALYNTADVIVFPVGNLHGKFDVPLVIIEAYACGKPVILSDLEQFREFANDRICVTIPKDSGAKLIESVAYLKENKEFREALGREARTFAEQHFDLKNTARQYEALYASL